MLHTSQNPSVFSFSLHQSSRTCRNAFPPLHLFPAVAQKLFWCCIYTGPWTIADVCVCQLLVLTTFSLWIHTLLKIFSNKSLFWWLSGKTELVMKWICSGFELWPMCTSATNIDQFLNASCLQTISVQRTHHSRRNRNVFNAQSKSKWGSCPY